MTDTFYPAIITDTGISQLPELRHVAISVSKVGSVTDAQIIWRQLEGDLGRPVGGIYNPPLCEAYFYCFVPRK